MPTITKRFKALGIESTEETRRAYRALMFTTPGAEAFLAGVILFEETIGQSADDGTPLPQVLARRGILPGIKVDKGTTPLPGAPGDLITQGLDGLAERLKGYKAQGMRFAKWREVYGVTDRNPTPLGIEANAEALARYAALCQEQGIVPIVEPEVLIDGNHSIERCHEVSTAVLHAVFDALYRHRVVLEGMVLKPSMVLPGKEHPRQATRGASGIGHRGSAAPYGSRRRAHDQFPLGRSGDRASDGQSQRDERHVSEAPVGAVILLRACAAGSGHAFLGRPRRERFRRATGVPPAHQDEQPRAPWQMGRGDGARCLKRM